MWEVSMYLCYLSVNGKKARELKYVIRKFDYVSGCLFTPDVLMLSRSVFTMVEMHCKTPIEWTYYGTTKIGSYSFVSIKIHCSTF